MTEGGGVSGAVRDDSPAGRSCEGSCHPRVDDVHVTEEGLCLALPVDKGNTPLAGQYKDTAQQAGCCSTVPGALGSLPGISQEILPFEIPCAPRAGGRLRAAS